MHRLVGSRREGTIPDPTSALIGRARNPAQVQRFLQFARNLSWKELRDVQRAYENPTFGRKDIHLRVGLASASTDYTALAREQGISYRKVYSPNRRDYMKYGPGLEPMAEVTSLIAQWTTEFDPKDFITLYAPFLRCIPLEGLGFSDDWMVLANPALHARIVAQYEAVLKSNAGARALPQSLLPATTAHVAAALCFEAALEPSRRDELADELVELASFVADSEANIVAASESTDSRSGSANKQLAAPRLARIRDQELALMRWLGTIDVDQVKEAAANLKTSAVRIGSDTTLQLATKSKLLLNTYLLALAAALVSWFVTILALGEFTNGGAWVAGFAWALLVGGAVMLGDNWLITNSNSLWSSGIGTARIYRSLIYTATVLVSSALVAGPWIVLVRFL